ncbi:MAG: helix-turn-helix domain-containing protein [Alistipes sp.]|nr:helix-turn-helix domain-containing protein [Alistipes sp.]
MMEKIKELDIAEMIEREGGRDFMIDLNIPFPDTSISDNMLIRNGVLIILCKSGNGVIVIDGKQYRLANNNVIILPENHIIEPITPALMERVSIIAVSVDYILNMPSPIDTNIFGYSRYISAIKVADDKFDDLMSYYRFIYKETLQESKYKAEIIHSIFYALILEIIAEYEKMFVFDTTNNIKADNLTDRFFKLLAVNYRKYRSVQFYAEQMNLTPKYLSTVVKRKSGRPILDWIHEAILIDAKMLLRTTELTVQQIAEQLNFSSPSAFVQFVKKHTGHTPTELK